MIRAGLKLCGRNPTHTPDGDHRQQRADVARVEQVEVGELLAVEEERERADGDDAGGEAVEAVDEVDRLADPEQPEHRDQRLEVVGEDDRAVVERQAEREHDHAEPDERETGEHRAGHLGRRGDLLDVVDEPDGEDDRAAISTPSGSELLSNTTSNEPISQAVASAATNPTNIASPPTSGSGVWCTVRSFGRYTQPCRFANQMTTRGGHEGDDGCHGTDQQIGTELGHGRSFYGAPPAAAARRRRGERRRPGADRAADARPEVAAGQSA